MKVRHLALWATFGVAGSSAGALALPLPHGGGWSGGGPPSATAPIVEDPPIDPSHVSMGKTLQLDARVGHASIDATSGADTFLFASVRAADAKGIVAPPLHLAVVIDRSGSMKGDRIANATAAAIDSVERMREGDVVTVVTFDTTATVVVPPTTTSVATRPQIEAAIRGIRVGGDTCISCGLEKGMDALMSMTNASALGDHLTRMLLLSDGKTNAGIRDVPGLRALAGRMRERGCTISTIGVDVESDEKGMPAIASEANGKFYFVANPGKLNEVFAEEFASLVTTVAQNAELTIELAPGVEVEQVFDRSYRQEGSVLHIALDTFSAKQEKTVLAKVHVPAGSAGTSSVATVKMKYRDVAASSDVENDGKLAVRLVTDGSNQKELDPFVSARVSRSATASTLNEANDLFQKGEVGAAKAKLEQAQTDLKKSAEVARRVSGAGHASAPGADGLVKDFDRQISALSMADDSFAAPPSPVTAPAPRGGGFGGAAATATPAFAAPPASQAARSAPSREEKVQVKKNAVLANEFGF